MDTLCRRPRRMPTMSQVVAYWAERIEMPADAEPFCFRCLRSADGWQVLERAHLIDRATGGLDAPQNLVPCCWACHRRQPLFAPSDETTALAWFHMPEVGTLPPPKSSRPPKPPWILAGMSKACHRETHGWCRGYYLSVKPCRCPCHAP